MSLLDLFTETARFLARHPFPVYIEMAGGDLVEVDAVDFRSGCAGTVLVAAKPLALSTEEWDDELCELRDMIDAEWERCENRSDAAKAFHPSGDVPTVEATYRLLEKTHALLNRMYDK